MSTRDHERFAYRLSEMLLLLNQGESLEPKALAERFGVDVRTIQRDLNVRLGVLQLEKVEGRYRLDPRYLGRLGAREIREFVALAGLSGLFPEEAGSILRELFDLRLHEALLVKGHHYEDLSGKDGEFRALERAIVDRAILAIDYQRADDRKRYSALKPYRLMNQKGIWYLAAVDGDTLKTFAFTRILAIERQGGTFDAEPSIIERLKREDGIWFTEKPIECLIAVSPEVAPFFRRRKLIANQEIASELPGGGLRIRAVVGHENQVLPIVRYWIPHLRIEQPTSLWVRFLRELQDFAASEAPQ
ncbi:WYL domain-containing protein [Niveibacterium sp. 24ML]|uniref:helix-turn-helix transcriptional regulator n=1 Tax=Niveibacterium sp. 24ML TaxID=2985512 RepID=UPI002271E38E|nr:WYL domain-containing transcriptional regulator [Niveibacterium sp. 24ML]MCX9157782.1 WYL domain-containing protein [Niveibacterium sp. 24ML]